MPLFSVKRRYFIIASISIIIIFLPLIIYVYLIYIQTPLNIRRPVIAHHHFRMKLLLNNEKIDFGQDKFQETYTEGVCSDGLTETPIHFHDNLDQLVHIHWDKISGGQVLKYYGLNLTGGESVLLGYRQDISFWPKKVPILGKLLPTLDKNSKFWVYISQENGEYKEKNIEEFLHQDLETFFEKKSSLTIQREDAEEFSKQSDIFNLSIFAHNPTNENSNSSQSEKSEDNTTINEISETNLSQEELKEINNLIGDVVIFVQEQAPSQETIEEEFSTLVPLQKSLCGG